VKQFIIAEPTVWKLTGELTFATVASLLEELTAQPSQPAILDLQEVTRTDSAGVALLIELLRQTKSQPITFQNLPPQMLSIAEICGVRMLLMGAKG